MISRAAACSCGRLRLEASGEPVRVSVCHCLACQRRTGSAFAVQARFPTERVHVDNCGATVFYTTSDTPDLIAVAVGAVADPSFPPATVTVYDSRRHPWVALADTIEHDLWESLRSLYESGAYAEAADRGRELILAHAEQAELLYNVACCESLAGRAADAIDHLRRAIVRSQEFRALAADDSDFDPIRNESVFNDLVQGIEV